MLTSEGDTPVEAVPAPRASWVRVYAMFMPTPPSVTRHAIFKLYCILQQLHGFDTLPMIWRADFRRLKFWVNHTYPDQTKAKLILNYLYPHDDWRTVCHSIERSQS